MKRKTTKGQHTGRGNIDNAYAPPCLDLESEAAAASSYLEPAIPFAFGGKYEAKTVVGYTKIVFTVFARISLSSSTAAGIDKYTVTFGAAI